ncbi:MAG: histidine kinase, partial [Lachnospiraceae bacterium]|nr:histidine kinase [Lachnospiraceae bacterium]
MPELNVYLQSFAAVVMGIILVGNVISGYRRDKSTSFFYGMMIVDIIMLVFGAMDQYTLYHDVPWTYHLVFSGISDCFYFFILGFFILYLDSYAREPGFRMHRISILGASISGVYGILWLVSDYFGLIYMQDATSFAPGPLYVVGQLGGYVTAVLMIFILISRVRNLPVGAIIGFAIFIFGPLIGSIFRSALPDVVLMPPLVTLSVIILQCFVQVAREILVRQQGEELAQMKTTLLMSRVKPHFVYNVLNTIYVLCDKSPERAREAVDKFSTYLRSSLVDLDSQTMIPFVEEMKHVQNYLSIEKMRFEDELEVSFDLGAMDFKIPPLVLQTIVENAVRHGIEKAPDGGNVDITTKEEADAYCITVTDNGVGFDTSSLEHLDFRADETGRRHVGIYSTMQRLKSMCDGTLTITS